MLLYNGTHVYVNLSQNMFEKDAKFCNFIPTNILIDLIADSIYKTY